jgi:hypothetical protein
LEDNKCRACRLDPRKSKKQSFQLIFTLGTFWGSLSRYAANPLIVALSPVHSDITRFRPLSQLQQEIVWIVPNKKIQKLLRR